MFSETFYDCHGVQKVVNSVVSTIRERVNPIVINAVGDLWADCVTLAQQHCCLFQYQSVNHHNQFHMSANLWPLIPWEKWVIQCTTWPRVFSSQLFYATISHSQQLTISSQYIATVEPQLSRLVGTRWYSPDNREYEYQQGTKTD